MDVAIQWVVIECVEGRFVKEKFKLMGGEVRYD